MLIPGLYEQVINNELRSKLETIEEERRYTEKIDSAEATDILSSYAAERIKSRLKQIAEGKDNDVPGQVALVNKVLGVLAETETEKDDTLTIDVKAYETNTGKQITSETYAGEYITYIVTSKKSLPTNNIFLSPTYNNPENHYISLPEN